MIKAVLFDLDGTLIDSESYYVNGTIEWLSKCGINIDFLTVSGIIGKTNEDTYSYISEISGLDIETIAKKNTNYFTNINPLDFKKLLFKDVIKCFEELKKQNIIIAICSMSPNEYINKFIDDCELNKYIDHYYSGHDCKYTKPNPEIYNKAIDSLKLNKKDVLIVEDAPSGLKAGKDSGAYVVARNNAKFGLNQDNALYILEDLKELTTIIMEINNGKYD